jgi:hypothetical protein
MVEDLFLGAIVDLDSLVLLVHGDTLQYEELDPFVAI